MAETTSAPDNTDRFTGRTESYARHRQGYPPEALGMISEHFNFPREAHLLDLGSGTGILTAQLLQHFPTAAITAVEPNKDMRDYSLSDPKLQPFTRSGLLQIINGSAEATTLPPESVDAIFAGAAFHWFDGPPTRKEILRIGKKSTSMSGEQGVPFIIFTSHHGSAAEAAHASNDIRGESRWGQDGHWKRLQERMRDFRQKTGSDYTQRVQESKFSKEYLNDFYGHSNWKATVYDGSRELTLDEIIGGMDSYSSNPKEGTKEFEKMSEMVKKIFAEFERNGKVKVVRDRLVYYGYVR